MYLQLQARNLISFVLVKNFSFSCCSSHNTFSLKYHYQQILFPVHFSYCNILLLVRPGCVSNSFLGLGEECSQSTGLAKCLRGLCFSFQLGLWCHQYANSRQLRAELPTCSFLSSKIFKISFLIGT